MNNIVITYRHEDDDSYLPLIDMAVENMLGWDYKPIIVGNITVPKTENISFHNKSPLMIWILEAQLEYLKSEMFNCNSLFFSPDALIIKPIHDKFTGFDLGVALKEGPRGIYTLNNGVIFISPKNKDKLIRLWEDAIEVCRNYRVELQEWGGDQKALHDVLKKNWEPYGLAVTRFDWADYNAPISKNDPILDNNIMAQAHIIHFKGPRKPKMAEIWNKIKSKIYG